MDYNLYNKSKLKQHVIYDLLKPNKTPEKA